MTAIVTVLAVAARGTAFVVTNDRAFVRLFASVTGPIYTSLECDPTIRLFTKEGCTLCDKVKDTLQSLREELPHSLEAVDITDLGHEDWYEKYKYDIPVLHVGDQYWIKHRISEEEAREGLRAARMGQFSVRKGEPDAGKMERRQAERQEQK
jgi:glutaredoxin